MRGIWHILLFCMRQSSVVEACIYRGPLYIVIVSYIRWHTVLQHLLAREGMVINGSCLLITGGTGPPVKDKQNGVLHELSHHAGYKTLIRVMKSNIFQSCQLPEAGL